MTLRAYAPGDRPQLRALVETVWGQAPPDDELDWWYGANPARPSLLAVVEEDGRLVSTAAMLFLPARIGGGEVETAWPIDAATHPDARGRGLWARLARHNDDEAARSAAAILSFTSEQATPVLMGKLGMRDLARLRLWARPLLRTGGGDPRFAAEAEGTRFGAEAERLYEELAPRWPAHVVRRAAHLNWRYADSPRPYRILADAGGYAVVTHKRFGGRHVGAVVELVGRDGRTARRLLRRCAEAVRGVRLLLALVPHAERAVYAAAGFVPTPRTLRLIGRPVREGLELPAGAAGWRLTLGDTDFF